MTLVQDEYGDWVEVANRDVVGHVMPHTPNTVQRYACEEPENPSTHHILWHTACEKCLLHLKATVATCGGRLVLMTHGHSDFGGARGSTS